MKKGDLHFGEYSVEYDGLCWGIYRVGVIGEWSGKGRKPKNIGKEYKRPLGWFPTLKPALLRLLEEKISSAGAEDAHEIIAAMDSAREEILAALERV